MLKRFDFAEKSGASSARAMKIRSSHESGSFRLGCILVIIVGGLFWAGGQGLYTYFTNRKPTAISYQDYLKTKPKAVWLMLTNCVLAISRASYMTVAGAPATTSPTEIFIPVRSSFDDDGKVSVLLASRNPEYLATFAEMQNLESKSDAEAAAWGTKNYQRIFPRRDVVGLVRFGMDRNDKDSKLANLYKNAEQGMIIIDENKEPSLVTSLALVMAGFALVVAGVLIRRRNQESSVSDVI